MRELVVSLLIASGLTLTGVSSYAVDQPSQDTKMEQPATDQVAAQPKEIKGEVTSFKEDILKLKDDELGMTHSFDIKRLENADELKENPLEPGDMVIVKLDGGKAISIERFEGDEQASAEDPAREAREMSDESLAKRKHPQDADSMRHGMKEDDAWIPETPSQTETDKPFGIYAIDEQGVVSTGEGEYVVKEGDTLSEIAEERLGSQAKWDLIARANNLEDPDIIYVGQHLSMPSGSEEGQRGS